MQPSPRTERGQSIGTGAFPRRRNSFTRCLLMSAGFAAALLGGCGQTTEPARSSKALKTGTAQERLQAARALGDINDPGAIQPLIAALDDKDAAVQGAVLDSIRKKGASAVDLLLAELERPGSHVHRLAIELLGATNDPRAIGPLLATLRRGSAEERKAAAEALGRIGKLAFDPVQALFNEGNPEVQPHAIKALGEIGDDRAVPLLLARLNDSNLDVRRSAVEALEHFNDPRIFDAVFPLLKEPEIRVAAVNALGSSGSTQMAKFAAALKGQLPNELRLALVQAVGKTHTAEALPILRTQLLRATAGDYPYSDANTKLKEETEKALSQLGPAAVAPMIKILREDEFEDVWMSGAATDVLRANTDGTTIQLVIDELLNGRNHGSGQSCAYALSHLASGAGQAAKDANLAKVAMDGILAAFKSEKSSVREAIASAVESDPNPIIERELLNAIEKKDIAVVKGAYSFFIKEGIAGTEDLLVTALNRSEDFLMGEAYLNCGNEKLVRAARYWAGEHGFTVNRSDYAPTLRWGEKR